MVVGEVNQPKKKRRKGPHIKHVPVRMCVSCREREAKRGLTRIVRTPEGTVEIDPTGKRNGRGAYLCDQRECWHRALKSGALSRALNVTLTTQAIELLREHAETLSDRPREPVAVIGGGTS